MCSRNALGRRDPNRSSSLSLRRLLTAPAGCSGGLFWLQVRVSWGGKWKCSELYVAFPWLRPWHMVLYTVRRPALAWCPSHSKGHCITPGGQNSISNYCTLHFYSLYILYMYTLSVMLRWHGGSLCECRVLLTVRIHRDAGPSPSCQQDSCCGDGRRRNKKKRTHTYACMYVCIYIYIYTHTHIYIYICMYV